MVRAVVSSDVGHGGGCLRHTTEGLRHDEDGVTFEWDYQNRRLDTLGIPMLGVEAGEVADVVVVPENQRIYLLLCQALPDPTEPPQVFARGEVGEAGLRVERPSWRLVEHVHLPVVVTYPPH